jgi:hypothetical protein
MTGCKAENEMQLEYQNEKLVKLELELKSKTEKRKTEVYPCIIKFVYNYFNMPLNNSFWFDWSNDVFIA